MDGHKGTCVRFNAIIGVIMMATFGAEAVWLELPPHGIKCFSEEIQQNTAVMANYTLTSINHRSVNTMGGKVDSTMGVKVTSPFGKNLHSSDEITEGKFAFITPEPGNYQICFWIDSKDKGMGGNVNLDWKIGIAAKDWDSVAKKEKLQGVELELRKLADKVEMIHLNYLVLKSKEMEMRDESERTNARVAWLSLLSIAVCAAVAGLQIWYLRSYFQKKKLI